MLRRIIIVLLAIVALTAKAQLTDWRNISSHNFVMKIIHDQNFLYVGTKGGGIVKIDKQSGEQTVLKRADGSMTGNYITDMAFHNGELWVGTEFNGLAKSISMPTVPCSWEVSHLCTLSMARNAQPHTTSICLAPTPTSRRLGLMATGVYGWRATMR